MKPEAHTLTLREAFERFCLPDLSNKNTIGGYKADIARWEDVTGNPVLADITNTTLADFRDGCLERGLSPATINTKRGSIRAILRRVGPPEHGNPLGEGIIDRVAYFRKLPEPRAFPRIYSLRELDAMYRACDVATGPRSEIPAPDFWRCLLVVGYNLIPRRGDIAHLKTESIDWERGVVRWNARKTRKWHVVPMNDVVQAHLRRIWIDREYVFSRRDGKPPNSYTWDRYYDTLRAILNAAGVEDPPKKPIHALRRTGASFLNSVIPGIADIVGGWGLKGVAANYYVNPAATGDLQRAVTNLPQPAAFAAILEQPGGSKSLLDRRTPARATEWEFTAMSATWRGTTIPFRGCRGGRLLRALQLLVFARQPLSYDDFDRLLFWEREASRTRMKTQLWQLRQKLKNGFPLPPMFDPIPFVDTGYILRLP